MQQPKEKQKSLLEVFNKFARDAVRDFPDLQGKLAILDVDTGKYTTGTVDLEKTGFVSMTGLNNYVTACLREAKKQKVSLAFRVGVDDFHVIAVNGGLRGLVSSPERKTTFLLNHELGHYVVPGAYYNKDSMLYEKNHGECAADVYACLKLFQQYGTKTGYARALAGVRAIDFIFRGHGGRHFTSFAVEAVNVLKYKIDFTKLTPEQMVVLSKRIAERFSPGQKVLTSLTETFADLRKGFTAQTSFEEKMKALADLICKDDVDYYTFKAGASILSVGLKKGLSAWDKRMDLTTEYWNGVRKKLKEKEFKLVEKDLLRDIPQVKGNVIPFPKPPSR